MLIIAKFGGTSVGNANAFKQVASIVKSNSNIRVVVLSAMSGVTNALRDIFNQTTNNRKAKCQIIIDMHKDIIEQLGLDIASKQIEPIVNELCLLAETAANLSHLDQLLSIGERLSSLILTELLIKENISALLVDSRELIITDDHFGKASPILAEIKFRCRDKISAKLKDFIILTQGFIGCTNTGLITTLGRGGSDYSAGLLAEFKCKFIGDLH